MDAEKLFWSRPQVGWTLERTFISSGKSLLLTSFVALQATVTCPMDSTGASQSEQAGLVLGWSMESLSLVRKSPVRNFMWTRSFLASPNGADVAEGRMRSSSQPSYCHIQVIHFGVGG